MHILSHLCLHLAIVIILYKQYIFVNFFCPFLLLFCPLAFKLPLLDHFTSVGGGKKVLKDKDGEADCLLKIPIWY